MRQRGVVVAGLVAGAVAVGLAVRSIVLQLEGGPLVRQWMASQYWLDYRDGLVRRGLPGALLRLLSGGRPDGTVVTWVGAGLTIAALAATVVLVLRAARGRWLVVAVLALSPITFGMVLRDIGRYDALVVLAFAFFALAPAPRRWPMAVVAAAVLLVAGGTEEFAVAYLLPLVLLWSGWRGVRLAAVVAPGIAVALLSIVARPSAALVADVIDDARAEGVQASNIPNYNAVVVLRNGLREQIDFVFGHSRTQMIMAFVVFAAFYAVVVVVLRSFVTSDRRLLPLAAWQAGVATLLCAIGVDFRRWWMLAAVALVAGGVRLPADVREDAVPAIRPALIGALLLVSAVFQEVPVESFWFPQTMENYFT